jgi:4-amino-4-deoxy-L-arabinose transferase-like glycosyltransferase
MLMVGVLLLAFLLRVNGLSFGLPYLFHDDEHQYVDAGIAWLQDWDAAAPHLYRLNNPPLLKMILGLLYSLLTRILMPTPEKMQMVLASTSWRTFFQYFGRYVSVSAAVLSVAWLYLLGKRLYNRRTGILAAFLLAVCFLHVRESHFAVNDALLTLMVVASLYVAAGIVCRGTTRDYLTTGFLIGLAAATKYTGIQLVSVLLAAHGLGRREAKAGFMHHWVSRRLLLGLGAVLLGFGLGAPFAVIAWRETLRRIGELAEYGRFGYHGLLMDAQGGWIFYLKTLAWGAGWVMLAAWAAVLVMTLIFRHRQAFLLWVSPILLYISLGQQKMFFARFILPAVPPLLLLVAAWLEQLGRWSSGSAPGRVRRALPAAALVLLAAQPTVMSVWFGVLLGRPDTREMASEWMSKNIPDGSVVHADAYALGRNSVTGHVSRPYVEPWRQAFDYPDLFEYYRNQKHTNSL